MVEPADECDQMVDVRMRFQWIESARSRTLPEARTSTSRDSVIEHGNLSERGSAPLRGRHTHTRYCRALHRTRQTRRNPAVGGRLPARHGRRRPKNAVGKTFTLELPDGRTGK